MLTTEVRHGARGRSGVFPGLGLSGPARGRWHPGPGAGDDGWLALISHCDFGFDNNLTSSLADLAIMA